MGCEWERAPIIYNYKENYCFEYAFFCWGGFMQLTAYCVDLYVKRGYKVINHNNLLCVHLLFWFSVLKKLINPNHEGSARKTTSAISFYCELFDAHNLSIYTGILLFCHAVTTVAVFSFQSKRQFIFAIGARWWRQNNAHSSRLACFFVWRVHLPPDHIKPRFRCPTECFSRTKNRRTSGGPLNQSWRASCSVRSI